MDENATPIEGADNSNEQTKTPLSRKALILTGAAIGLIIAGGFAIFKKQEDLVVETDVVIDFDEPSVFDQDPTPSDD